MLIDTERQGKDLTKCVAWGLCRMTKKTGLRDFVGYGQPLWLPHTGQAQGQPVHLVSTP